MAALFNEIFDGQAFGKGFCALADAIDVRKYLLKISIAGRNDDRGQFTAAGDSDLLAFAGALDQFGKLLLGFK